MISVSACVATLAALQVVVSASQDFSSLFETPANLRNFHPNANGVAPQPWAKSLQHIASRSSWTSNTNEAPRSTGFRSNSYKWSTAFKNNNQQHQQLTSRTHINGQQHRTKSMMMSMNMKMRSDDAQPEVRLSSGSIPNISVPPLLPPLPDVTEQQLYGSVNVDALTAPYSLGDNSTENQTPIQLPDTSQVVTGSNNMYYHGFANSNKVQDVVSNHLINTFTNQTNRVQVNNLDLHRFYKLINATTNYITNVQRVNQSAIFNQITNNNATEYQPYLYITQSQTNVVNDNGQAVQLPVIESSSVSSVALPPVFDTPVVTKFDYNGNPVPISPAAGKK